MRNKTIIVSPNDKYIDSYKIINGDFFIYNDLLADKSIDLCIIDPPYNLTKNYNGKTFNKMSSSEYKEFFENIIKKILPKLKPTSTIYICSDWQTSLLIGDILQKYFTIHNRITWARDKGRSAKSNYKNNSEDIWFCTMSDEYYFNADAVKHKKKVIAPYKQDGVNKDWQEDKNGKYRYTGISNIWDDITVPFWSMAENTPHPTQKPEKLIAKLVLASSKEDDLVYDPFLGSGTTAVVCKKLNRDFVGIEQNKEYCIIAQKRLNSSSNRIQGYENGVFIK